MESREIKANINDTKLAIRYVNNAIDALHEGRSDLSSSTDKLNSALGGNASSRLFESIRRGITDIDSEVSELQNIKYELQNAAEELEEKDRELAKNN